jgi:hypothetical protein
MLLLFVQALDWGVNALVEAIRTVEVLLAALVHRKCARLERSRGRGHGGGFEVFSPVASDLSSEWAEARTVADRQSFDVVRYFLVIPVYIVPNGSLGLVVESNVSGRSEEANVKRNPLEQVIHSTFGGLDGVE